MQGPLAVSSPQGVAVPRHLTGVRVHRHSQIPQDPSSVNPEQEDGALPPHWTRSKSQTQPQSPQSVSDPYSHNRPTPVSVQEPVSSTQHPAWDRQ